MKYIECNLPDINFIISIPNEFYEQGCKKIFESIIPYKKIGRASCRERVLRLV